MPLEINLNGGGERQCAWCGVWFTPEPSYYRCCCDEHFGLWRDAERHEWVEQGRAMQRRDGRQASESELQAARTEGYQQGWEAAGPYTQAELDAARTDGYHRGKRDGYAYGWWSAAVAMRAAVPEQPDDDALSPAHGRAQLVRGDQSTDQPGG